MAHSGTKNHYTWIVNVQGIQFLLFPIPLSLTGRLLFDYLCHKSSVSETAVCGLMTQLLEALHYLHSHLIVHLDVRVRPSIFAPTMI